MPAKSDLVMKFTNISDGTGESAVAKIDVSGLTVNAVTGRGGYFYNGLGMIDSNGGTNPQLRQPDELTVGNDAGSVTLSWDTTASPYKLIATCVRGANYQKFAFKVWLTQYDGNSETKVGAQLI